MTHANFEFGETNGRCNNCSSRTALISIYGSGNVDQEPFATGECAEESAEHQCGVEIPESVEFNDEITAHFCFQCNCLTTLCINAEKRNKQEKIDIDLEIALFKHRLSEHSVDIDVIVLSEAEGERRKATAQITALLTHQTESQPRQSASRWRGLLGMR